MLVTIFGSKLRAKILGWLYTHPDERYFVRQLTKLLKADSTNVSRELKRLEKVGILVSVEEGRQKYYRVNRKSPVYNEFHGLVIKTVGIADVLRSALTPLSSRIHAAFIFGSFANNSEHKASDIDVMVIGEISFDDVVILFSEAEETLGREINSVIYPVAEFKEKVEEGHHFIKTVLGNKKVFLIGDENEFRRMAE